MSGEFLSGNRLTAYPLARRCAGGFDVSRLLVDASVGCDCSTGTTPWLHGVDFDASGVTVTVCAARDVTDDPRDWQYLRLTTPVPTGDDGPWVRVFGHVDAYEELEVSLCATLVLDAAALRAFADWSRAHGNAGVVDDIPFCARCVGFGRPRVERIELVTRKSCCPDEPVVPYFLT